MLCTSPPPASPVGSEISVGAPSPPPPEHRPGEDYFRPLKKLKMAEAGPVPSSRERSVSPPPPQRSSIEGVKSFSIADILGHEPQQSSLLIPHLNNHHHHHHHGHQNQLSQSAKIVRPWDHLRGPVPVRPFLPPALLHYEHRLALDYQRQLQEHLTAQAQLLRHMSMEIIPSESGSERSSSAASDCCSPEIGGGSRSTGDHHRQQQSPSSSQGQKTKPNGTPLDALFQMTNKSFDESQGEDSSGNLLYFDFSRENIQTSSVYDMKTIVS